MSELKKPIIPKPMEIKEISLNDFLTVLKEKSGYIPRSDTYGEGKHIVIVNQDAEQQIRTFFDYGKGFTAINREEQKAVLYGHIFRDGSRYIYYITRAAYIYPAVRSETFVATSDDNDDDFMEHRLKLEQMHVNRNERKYNLDVKGRIRDVGLLYYPASVRAGETHSHPNLTCFFSTTDHRGNESTPLKPYAYMVCDPINMDFKAMVGTGHEPARIIFLEEHSNIGALSSPTRRYEIIPHDDGKSEAGLNKYGDKTSSDTEIVSNDISFSCLSSVCDAFLKQPGVRGKIRTFHDARGNAHFKYRVHFVCPDASASRTKGKHTEKKSDA